jgi:processive 1,2-diacylglycerol beta-glucosyltransferase
MSSKLDYLILTASTGGGHVSAAKALEDECRSRGLSVRCEDVLDFTPKGFKAWYRGGYELLVKRGPDIWGELYESSDKPGIPYEFQTVLDKVFCKPIDDMLSEGLPRWVIVTHSLPQPRVDLSRPASPGVRMAVVVTDLYTHKMWLRGSPDQFFVPSEWSAEKLEERHPAAKGITTVSGIPISPAFARTAPKEDIKRAKGFDLDRPLVVLAAGGIGAGPMRPIIKELAASGARLQLIVVCGRNASARRRLVLASLKLERPGDFDVTIKGFVAQPQMAELLNACDLLVSKPGGLTTTEAMAAGCPFLVADPFLIPGQEEGNAEFLVQAGIGERAATPEEVAGKIVSLSTNPEVLRSMSQAGLAHAKPQAAKAIIDRLESL